MSIRIAEDQVAHLDQLAKLRGLDRSELARRYLSEGMRMDEHPGICFREGPMGRRPAVIGTHLQVATIVSTARNNDGSIEGAARYHDVDPRFIETAMRYYAAYREEIDAWIEHSKRIAEHEEAKDLAAQRVVETLSA